MNFCHKYEHLTPQERVDLAGRIQHLFQTDCKIFDAVSSMIRQAEYDGVFDKIVFMPVMPEADYFDVQKDNFDDP